MSLSNIDQKFLEQYILSFKFIYDATLGSIGGLSSVEHKIILKSKFTETTGISNADLDKHFADPLIIKLRDKAIQSRKTVKGLGTKAFSDGQVRFFIITYSPVINPATNNVVAVHGNPKYIETFNLWAIFEKFYTHGQIKLHQFQSIKLTEREKQVIFLFLRNLDSHTIANIITNLENKKISKNAIDQIFTSQLMPKFEVYGRKSLKNKLIELGYYRFIPRNMLRNDFAIEITDYVVFEDTPDE